MGASKISSSDGAGSIEQISTAPSETARERKPRAAETVVLPTPPLPRTSISGVVRTGHGTGLSLNFGGRVREERCAFHFEFFPEKTFSANCRRSFTPTIGNPGSSAMQIFAERYSACNRDLATRAAAALPLHGAHFPGPRI